MALYYPTTCNMFTAARSYRRNEVFRLMAGSRLSTSPPPLRAPEHPLKNNISWQAVQSSRSGGCIKQVRERSNIYRIINSIIGNASYDFFLYSCVNTRNFQHEFFAFFDTLRETVLRYRIQPSSRSKVSPRESILQICRDLSRAPFLPKKNHLKLQRLGFAFVSEIYRNFFSHSCPIHGARGVNITYLRAKLALINNVLYCFRTNVPTRWSRTVATQRRGGTGFNLTELGRPFLRIISFTPAALAFQEE